MDFVFLIIAIVWSVLCLILFFKVWGMTNDVEDIKYILKSLINKKESLNIDNCNESNNSVQQSTSSTEINEGDIVINKENGEELKVLMICSDGDVTCKKKVWFKNSCKYQ